MKTQFRTVKISPRYAPRNRRRETAGRYEALTGLAMRSDKGDLSFAGRWGQENFDACYLPAKIDHVDPLSAEAL